MHLTPVVHINQAANIGQNPVVAKKINKKLMSG
jgi:hypothetical protein